MYLFMNNSNRWVFVSSIFFIVLLMGKGIFLSYRSVCKQTRYQQIVLLRRVYPNTRIIRMFIERIWLHLEML